ncbi:MAG: hypothetical protein IAG13_12805 [Deltaproteobacteria bacterium]|nr:hypothetical protein [Nannocystaceae bacterium]
MSPSLPMLAAMLAAAASCGPAAGSEEASDSSGPPGESSSSEESSTGDPVCTPPPAGAALELELGPGDAGLPAAGEAVHVAGDRDGNAIVVITDETEDDTDVVIAQVTPDGAPGWSVRYEGMAGLDDTALDIAVGADGDIYVLVSEQLYELVSEGFGNRTGQTLVVLALAPDGARRWRYARALDDEDIERARLGAIATTPEHELVVLDARADTTVGDGPVLTVLDRWGNLGVQAELSGALEIVMNLDIAIASGGDVLATATVYPALWNARIARDGSVAWSDVTPPQGQRATAIAAGREDDAYVLVTTGDEEAGDAGFELQRFAADGSMSVRYTHAWPGGAGYPAAVVVDCAGTPIIAGEIQHGDGSGVTDREAWLAAIAPDGSALWSETLTGTRPIAPRSLALTDAGTFWLGGLTGDPLGPWLAHARAP